MLSGLGLGVSSVRPLRLDSSAAPESSAQEEEALAVNTHLFSSAQSASQLSDGIIFTEQWQF